MLNVKYYLDCKRKANFCRKFICAHVWQEGPKIGHFLLDILSFTKMIFFIEIFSFDFPENSLKGELLWYSTSNLRFHVWHNSRSGVIARNDLDGSAVQDS